MFSVAICLNASRLSALYLVDELDKSLLYIFDFIEGEFDLHRVNLLGCTGKTKAPQRLND